MKIIGRHMMAMVSLTAGLLAGCATGGGPMELSASPKVPAARGVATIEEANNQNTSINLKVQHLAPPQKIDSRATAFVVWAQPTSQDGQPQNVGALRVDENLAGELMTITPFRDFKLFVTAEPSALASFPSSDPVMWVDVNRG